MGKAYSQVGSVGIKPNIFGSTRYIPTPIGLLELTGGPGNRKKTSRGQGTWSSHEPLSSIMILTISRIISIVNIPLSCNSMNLSLQTLQSSCAKDCRV